MGELSSYRRIISPQAPLWAFPLRVVLRGIEVLYSAIVAWRNARYDRHGFQHKVSVPVISVGNLTVGGTGKTPVVIELALRMDARGLSPAVVSRGYGSAEGEPNDEERLIRRRCSAAVCVHDADRTAGAMTAIEQFGADVIVLDDAFQHRRLDRSLDIVLIDATCPFGFGHMLPRGLLREPVSSLRRADVVMLTRCDQVSNSTIERIENRVRSLTDGTLLLRTTHRVVGIERLDGSPLAKELDGLRVVAFAGIGHPGAFLTTAKSQGAIVVGQRFWPDHHRYSAGQINSLMTASHFPEHDLLLTTEKDAVKLAELKGIDTSGIGVLKIAIDFDGDGGTLLDKVLDDVLHGARDQ